MEEVLNGIIKHNIALFGDNPKIKRINVGFTNTIYSINDSYIVKICTNYENEDNFKKEISFYNKNKNNPSIPKLYYSNIVKNDIPFLYEIIEKVKGVSLYSVWHTLSEQKREDIIKELCQIMKQIHSNKSTSYDWCKFMKEQFELSYKKVKQLHLFDIKEQVLIEEATKNFDKYLLSNDFVLIHNDLHFDNIIYDNGIIKLIDFERSMYAPRDYELDILYRMIRKPWKFASEETEQYTNLNQYTNIMKYIEKYYEDIINIPNLDKRLAIYDIVYFMNQLIEYPHLTELKDDIISATKKVISNKNI